MKKSAVLTALFLLSISVLAEPLCIIRNGKFTGRGYWLRQNQNTVPSPDGVVFNGRDAAAWIKLNKFNSVMDEFSIVADIIVNELPTKGNAAVASRIGYHNTLGVDSIGRANFSVYGKDKKTRKIIFSKCKLKTGEKHRIAGVIEKIEDNEYDIILYVDGREEGRATMYCAVFPYDRDYFYVGGESLQSQNPFFNGKIVNLWADEDDLSQSDIRKLQ